MYRSCSFIKLVPKKCIIFFIVILRYFSYSISKNLLFWKKLVILHLTFYPNNLSHILINCSWFSFFNQNSLDTVRFNSTFSILKTIVEFYCLNVLSRTSDTLMNNNCNGRYLCLILVLIVKIFPLRKILTFVFDKLSFFIFN